MILIKKSTCDISKTIFREVFVVDVSGTNNFEKTMAAGADISDAETRCWADTYKMNTLFWF